MTDALTGPAEQAAGEDLLKDRRGWIIYPRVEQSDFAPRGQRFAACDLIEWADRHAGTATGAGCAALLPRPAGAPPVGQGDCSFFLP